MKGGKNRPRQQRKGGLWYIKKAVTGGRGGAGIRKQGKGDCRGGGKTGFS